MASVIEQLSIIGEEPDRLKKWWDRSTRWCSRWSGRRSGSCKKLADPNTPWGIDTNGSPLQAEVIRAVGAGSADEFDICFVDYGVEKAK